MERLNEPQVVFGNWEDAPAEIVREGVRRRAFGTENVILVMNDIQPDMLPLPHTHESFDQIATVLSGRALYHVGAEAYHMGPGSLLLIPAGMEHWIEPDGDQPIENLDIFAPARADYRHLLEWMSAVPGAGEKT